MKAYCLAVILLLFLPAYGVRAGTIEGRNSNLRVAFWPEDCVVSVYFVRNMFPADEKQLLWSAIETWTLSAKKEGLQISFVRAGETGGLIDCAGCLTIARQVFATDGTRQHVSFNALREDDKGRLISAWIGFERATATEIELRTLMLQALERGLALSGSQATKGARS